MNILVINCGSSSVKYELFEMDARCVLTSGVLDRIGESGSRLKHGWLDTQGVQQKRVYEQTVAVHHAAFGLIRQAMRESDVMDDINELAAIGHRVGSV